MKFEIQNTVLLRLQNQIILAIKKNSEQIFTTLSFC